MASIGAWSTTDGSNVQTPPVGWPEGQGPETTNDCGRAVMASVARLFADVNGSLSATGTAAAMKVAVASDYSATAQVGIMVLSSPNTTSASATLELTRFTTGVRQVSKNGRFSKLLDDGDIQANQKFLIVADDRDGASSAFSLLTPPHKSPGMVLIASGNMTSAVATLTIGPIPGASAEVEIMQFTNSGASSTFRLRLGTVATIQAGVSDYEWTNNTTLPIGNTATGDTSDAQLIVLTNHTNAGTGIHGKIRLHGLNSDNTKAMAEWQLFAGSDGAGKPVTSSVGAGGLTSAISSNAIQFSFSTGNIAGGALNNYRVYRMME